MIQRLALAALITLSFGCASVPMATPQKDSAAKAFATNPDLASVYIYRNESIGAGVTMDVAIDGQPLGQTAAETFLYTELTPGKYTLTSEAENTDELILNLKAGQLYFIWQEVTWGWLYAQNELQTVDAPTGKRGVRQCKLAISKDTGASPRPASPTPET